MSALNYPITARAVYDESTTQEHEIGTKAKDKFGRWFRYVKAGGTLVVGNALQAPAQVANAQDLVPAAAAVGDETITVTNGGTAIAADQYADGYAIIDTTPGLGYTYPISGHAAEATGSAAFVLNLLKGWGVQVALTATSRVSLYSNPHRGVIQAPDTTLTNIPVGVAVYPITSGSFGWIGTGGVFGTLIQGTPGVGLAVGPPGSAAGSVAVNSSTNPIVGYMMDTGQDGKVEAVRWVLD